MAAAWRLSFRASVNLIPGQLAPTLDWPQVLGEGNRALSFLGNQPIAVFLPLVPAFPGPSLSLLAIPQGLTYLFSIMNNEGAAEGRNE